MNNEIPHQKPGTEPVKKLTELEYEKIQNHFLKKSITSMQSSIAAKNAEIAKLKQQMCDLNKQILVGMEADAVKEKDGLDKSIVDMDNQYDQTIRKDIKERLGIPLDKGFSWEPETLKVTVNE